VCPTDARNRCRSGRLKAELTAWRNRFDSGPPQDRLATLSFLLSRLHLSQLVSLKQRGSFPQSYQAHPPMGLLGVTLRAGVTDLRI
jgi:hypothetical protein